MSVRQKKPVGRPVLEDKAKIRSLRLTDADWLKLKAMGGIKWLRSVLNGQ